MEKKSFCLITVIIFSFISVFSLFHPGFPPTHDGEYHVIRFYEFYKTLSDGVWYPRWATDLNNSYGLPLFNYVYPLPNYFASLFHFVGFSFIDSFKLNLIFATFIGGLFFYLWSRRFWGDIGGMISSIFYLFSPYRLVDIYVRGSVGELWALSIAPAFLWSITIYIRDSKKVYGVLSSIFISLIIFSHNILALMFIVFGFLYAIFLVLIQKRKLKDILMLIFIFVFGILIASVFWMPALFETSYVRGLQIYDYSRNFPEIYQLLIPSWGTYFSGHDLSNEMSYQIGVANLIAVLAVIFYSLFFRKKKEFKVLFFFLFFFFLVFYLMTPFSLTVWKIVPLMNYFQFPWRLLSLEVIIAPFLAGSIFLFKPSRILAFLFVFFAVFISYSYTQVAYYHNRDDSYYISRPNFILSTNSPGNVFNTRWMDGNLESVSYGAHIISGQGEIKLIKKNAYMQLYKVSNNSNAVVEVSTAYFPGWEASAGNNYLSITPTKKGLIQFKLSKGNHEVVLRFVNTPIRTIASYISLVCLLAILFYIARRGFVIMKK